MAQQTMVRAPKPDNLSSVPGMLTVEGKKNYSVGCLLTSTHML